MTLNLIEKQLDVCIREAPLTLYLAVQDPYVELLSKIQASIMHPGISILEKKCKRFLSKLDVTANYDSHIYSIAWSVSSLNGSF